MITADNCDGFTSGIQREEGQGELLPFPWETNRTEPAITLSETNPKAGSLQLLTNHIL